MDYKSQRIRHSEKDKIIILRYGSHWKIKGINNQLIVCRRFPIYSLPTRVRPRFFDQVGHETMYASSGYKHFFTKSCNHQTYQNY